MLPTLMLTVTLAAIDAPQEEIRVSLESRVEGRVDQRHIAHVRASVKRFVSPDEFRKADVQIGWLSRRFSDVVAVIKLPSITKGDHRLHRSVVLRPDGWSFLAPPSARIQDQRWSATRSFRATRLFRLGDETVDIALDDQMSFVETRSVLRAVALGKVTFAETIKRPPAPPSLDKIVSVSRWRGPRWRASIEVRTTQSRVHGRSFRCTLSDGKLTIDAVYSVRR